MRGEMLWQPTPQQAAGSQMQHFLDHLARRHRAPSDYPGAWRWSCDHKELFWQEMLDFAQISLATPADETCTAGDMRTTRWFPGGRLNYARHLLRFDDEQDAILFEHESGRTESLTHRALRREVARCASALRNDGVGVGDRVAGYMPNCPQTIIAMLAAASLGATWSSCSPDFGAGAVLDRFGQIEPKVLFLPDGYQYNGRRFDVLERAEHIVEKLPSLKRVVVVPYLSDQPDINRVNAYSGEALLWRDYLGVLDEVPEPLEFAEVPFDHPLFIMFSSGTTGQPKCIVHGHGGTLLQHMKEHMLHGDVRRSDRVFYFTTCGWMMWNWLVSAIGVGACIVLYDGAPTHPHAGRLWELAATCKINFFGTSPKFLGACRKAHLTPGATYDLAPLRAVLSTGSPLSDELFHWVYRAVKPDLMLASISGGTDIISCFMLGNPTLPVYAGEIQCRGLGMDVHAFNSAGQAVLEQKGELVCTTPFPCQPVAFWNDADGEKYRAAYFDHYPNVWRHGDFIEITDRGGIIVYGRSDATLNPGGIRIGTAEIYRIVEGLSEVVDSLAVGRRTEDDDVEIVLFVQLQPGLTLTRELIERLRTAIAAGASKRHVPRHIRQVPAIPHTISGKKVELAVQQILHGEDVTNRDALANPEALDAFRGAI